MELRLLVAAITVAAMLAVPAPVAAAPDAYGCNDNYFCIYDGNNFTGEMIQFGPGYTGAGWQYLGTWYWEYRANSVRNRRDRDSLLSVFPSLTQYCSDSHSSDVSLANNAIGNNSAAYFANVPDDIHC